MNRFIYYQKKVASKLLLSKFVYPTPAQAVRLKKTVVTALPTDRDPEISAFGLAVLASQFPSFGSNFHHTERSKTLRRIYLAGSNHQAFVYLQFLVNKSLPFQRENQKHFPKLSSNYEMNISLPECTPTNEVNYIFFKYPLTNTSFDLTIQLKFSPASLTESVFYSRLFQVPVEMRTTQR